MTEPAPQTAVSAAAPAGALVLDRQGHRHAETRAVAVETPVQVSYGGVPFGVMMLTPADLVDFAFGFSLTEGIIATATDVVAVEPVSLPDGLGLRVTLVGSKLHAHLARKRALSGRTSCGLCGIEDLAALPRAAARPAPAETVSRQAIETALDALDRHQPLSAETRAVHGAAWCNTAGQIICVREDVGRHNALDKLIGACLRAGHGSANGFILITSRASFEMVEKAAAFGAGTLVAISAPTSLAIERAQTLGLTLVGIARRDAMTVFCGAERIVG